MDYPNSQEISLKFDDLINMSEDRLDEWFTTCYPSVDLLMKPAIADRVELISIDEDTSTALIEINQIAQADLSVQRLSLNGYGSKAPL